MLKMKRMERVKNENENEKSEKDRTLREKDNKKLNN